MVGAGNACAVVPDQSCVHPKTLDPTPMGRHLTPHTSRAYYHPAVVGPPACSLTALSPTQMAEHVPDAGVRGADLPASCDALMSCTPDKQRTQQHGYECAISLQSDHLCRTARCRVARC